MTGREIIKRMKKGEILTWRDWNYWVGRDKIRLPQVVARLRKKGLIKEVEDTGYVKIYQLIE